MKTFTALKNLSPFHFNFTHPINLHFNFCLIFVSNNRKVFPKSLIIKYFVWLKIYICVYIYIIFSTSLFFHSNIMQWFPVQTLGSGNIAEARCQARLNTILWCRCLRNLTLMGNSLNIELYRTPLVNAVNTSCMIHCSYTQGVKIRFSPTATQLVKVIPVCHTGQP